MNPETSTEQSPQDSSRRQKLLRRFLPAAVLVAGGAASAANFVSDANPDHAPNSISEAHASVKTEIMTSAIGEFGGSDDDWGHGTAERVIREAIYKAATRSYAGASAEVPDGIAAVAETSPDEIKEIVDELPAYDEATRALEIAKYSEIVPDKGDKLYVSVKVTTEAEAGSMPVISYEVTDAMIQDLPNNQQ